MCINVQRERPVDEDGSYCLRLKVPLSGDGMMDVCLDVPNVTDPGDGICYQGDRVKDETL